MNRNMQKLQGRKAYYFEMVQWYHCVYVCVCVCGGGSLHVRLNGD